MVESHLQQVEYQFPPSLTEAGKTASAIVDQARGWGLADEVAEEALQLAVEEALANAVLHGVLRIEPKYRENGVVDLLAEVDARAAKPPYANRRVHVRLDHLPDAVRVTIDDGGPGFDVAHVPQNAAPEAFTGRGLMLIRSYMDAVHHNASGNRITMLKRFPHHQH
jgi:anti-sigma regulatory factor (Ser/Thr protein kinase)